MSGDVGEVKHTMGVNAGRSDWSPPAPAFMSKPAAKHANATGPLPGPMLPQNRAIGVDNGENHLNTSDPHQRKFLLAISKIAARVVAEEQANRHGDGATPAGTMTVGQAGGSLGRDASVGRVSHG